MTQLRSPGAMQMKLQSFRGYSAYEIAVQHGFEGSEAQWLESLRGADGSDASALSVNNVSPVDGNITLRGTDICLQPGVAVTVKQELDKKLSAAQLEERLASDPRILGKASARARSVVLHLDNWQKTENGLVQTIPVPGLTQDTSMTHAVVSPQPESLDDYAASGARATQQGQDTLSFLCTGQPAGDLSVCVLVVETGVGE